MMIGYTALDLHSHRWSRTSDIKTLLVPQDVSDYALYLDRRLDLLSSQIEELMLHVRTLPTPGTHFVVPPTLDGTCDGFHNTSPPDDIIDALFSDDDDSPITKEHDSTVTTLLDNTSPVTHDTSSDNDVPASLFRDADDSTVKNQTSLRTSLR
jgi:hypothetical protein